MTVNQLMDRLSKIPNRDAEVCTIHKTALGYVEISVLTVEFSADDNLVIIMGRENK